MHTTQFHRVQNVATTSDMRTWLMGTTCSGADRVSLTVSLVKQMMMMNTPCDSHRVLPTLDSPSRSG